MSKEKAGEIPANSEITPQSYADESAASQGGRIVEHLKRYHRLTTLEARRILGVMNPAQRISELRRKGAPIETGRTYQADETGAVHWVAVYLWRGENAIQADMFGGC